MFVSNPVNCLVKWVFNVSVYYSQSTVQQTWYLQGENMQK